MVRKKGGAKKGKAPARPPKPQQVVDTTQKPAVWLPGDAVEEGETLQYDPTAYDCLSSMSLDWPSLSFDILRDHLGAPRSAFPHTLFMVAGTQAGSAKSNYLAVMKVSGLGLSKAAAERQKQQQQQRERQHKGDDSDSDEDMIQGSDAESDADEEEAETAQLHIRKVAHTGGINRVRSCPQQPHVAASWADTAQVQVWDLGEQLGELRDEAAPAAGAQGKVHRVNARHVHTHSSEGYALDWSPVASGRLASGDCRARIHVWEPAPAGKWVVGPAYRGHESSVEDLQWSPTEETVFASASVDKTVRIWDTREQSKSMLSVAAHDSDVNVISWNRATTYMLASGGDDGALRVWDLRALREGGAVANLCYHRGPVTSVEWCPHEASMLATTGADNQLAVWDLALERDPEEEAALAPETNALAPDNLPPQLLFVHSGQHDMKEMHWHPQITGLMVSTAADGFNLFKPYNV
ncbi:hypothetical protein CHLNCDRAFT_135568 [Chlorella variabilis]|uniref:Glutamate-rich WD repeat-containing protein 1 n=1 Tax=Chlorella variabilis TaxID=554065 RepID=E1ZIH1_CHLVA|nr:hypothetical protein CHLNCDRAFT_135568 [Chlorella variabilis]EFN54331.1 hypothetical protein CHLNCDRAFT_135568 [Chlorella variabilis]|eukprot:XP_005846433.1 hypothetical protein CHLNCDRAFT_135568 [Chlorella variabilis]